MADFVNLGGLAGALALIWQLISSATEHYRRPRLTCLERYTFNVDKFDGHNTFRFVTLSITNRGRKSALGCVATATATPVSGQGSRREVSLHWADTPRPDDEVAIPVNIAPGGKRRLDVAVSRSGARGCWLATPRALSGGYSDDAELGEGEYTVEIWVTCEDGNKAKSLLHLRSSQEWKDLDASG